MSRLLTANFIRLWKDKIFWLCTAFMFGLGVFLAVRIHVNNALDGIFFSFATVIGIVSSIFCGLFIGVEHGDGTIRNKITVGRTRFSIYLSYFLVCTAAGILLCIAYAIPVLAIGIPKFGFFQLGAVATLVRIGIVAVMIAAFTAIYVLIAMLCQNKAFIAVLCMVVYIVLLLCANHISSMLNQPEYMYSWASYEGGGIAYASSDEMQPNPNYLSGKKREIYQFVLDFLPTGQGAALLNDETKNLGWLPVYSLIIAVSFTACGAVLFERKDLK